MTQLLSFIFDKITDPLSLPINPLYEWLILGVIGAIAYIASFRIVGDMYDSGDISGSTLGSICHWIIRLLIFVPIWFVVYWVIVIGQFVVAHWIPILCVMAGIITITSLVFFIQRSRTNKETEA